MPITHCEKCGWKLPEPSSDWPDTAQEVACPNPTCDWKLDADLAHAEENAASGGAVRKRRPRPYPTRQVHENRHNGQPKEGRST